MICFQNQGARDYYRTVEKQVKNDSPRALKAFRDGVECLHRFACDEKDPDRTFCWLFEDFAPYSFTFLMHRRSAPTEPYKAWFNGGLIYSGPGLGSDRKQVVSKGGAPSFAVSLDPVCVSGREHRWSVHT